MKPVSKAPTEITEAGSVAPGAVAKPSPARKSLWVRLLYSEYLVLYLSVIYYLVLWPFTPRFASPENLANLLSSMLPLLIVAVGQTFVLISGGIDLSATSVIALTSVTGAMAINGENGWLAGSSWAVPAGLILMMVVGGGVGGLNSLAVTRLFMPPFIVTLATMMFFSGFAIWLTTSKTIYGLPTGFVAIGKQMPLTLLVTGVAVIVAHILLRHSLYGRWLYAIGQNAKAARISGVPVNRVLVWTYVLSGVYAALASVLYTGRLETGSPVLGQRILLDVIGAAVIGGASLFGGKGKVLWTLFGVLFIALIDNSLNLLGLSHFTIMMVKGGVILVAAFLDSVRTNNLI